jgi:hypothetical protein
MGIVPDRGQHFKIYDGIDDFVYGFEEYYFLFNLIETHL